MKPVLHVLITGLLIAGVFAAGWFARQYSEPDSLVGAGVGVIEGVADTFHLERMIADNEKASKQLQRERDDALSEVEKARKREAGWQKRAVEQAEEAAEARQKVEALEAAAPDVKADIKAAETLLRANTPEACSDYAMRLEAMVADLKWEEERNSAKDSEIEALYAQISFRDKAAAEKVKEIAGLQDALALETERADDAEDILAAVKRRSKRSLIASVGAMAAIAYFAAR